MKTQMFSTPTLGLALIALAVGGCDLATTREPIGSTPVAPQEVEGVWRGADGNPFYVRIADQTAGRLEVATVVTNEYGFVLERTRVLLRREGDVVLANVRPEGGDDREGYMVGRVSGADDALVLMLAASPAIHDLAGIGVVGAEITTNRHSNGHESLKVVVTNGYDRLAAELASPAGWRLLDTGNPFVLTRQKEGLK
jgi:hypothetical protein